MTISIISSDQMMLDGFAAWIASYSPLSLLASATTVPELARLEFTHADVVILDLLLADQSDPVGNVSRLVRAGRRVLVVSEVARVAQGVDVLHAGALGFLTKDRDLTTVAAAAEQVAAGGTVCSPELVRAETSGTYPNAPRLSLQERAVLVAYVSGMILPAAARKAGVRPATAKKYLDRVKEKYRLAGRAAYTKLDLAIRVREDGLALDPNGRGAKELTEGEDGV